MTEPHPQAIIDPDQPLGYRHLSAGVTLDELSADEQAAAQAAVAALRANAARAAADETRRLELAQAARLILPNSDGTTTRVWSLSQSYDDGRGSRGVGLFIDGIEADRARHTLMEEWVDTPPGRDSIRSALVYVTFEAWLAHVKGGDHVRLHHDRVAEVVDGRYVSSLGHR